jgi:hypothetical protein
LTLKDENEKGTIIINPDCSTSVKGIMPVEIWQIASAEELSLPQVRKEKLLSAQKIFFKGRIA